MQQMTLDLPNPNITRLDNLQQRSTEWHKAREGKRTASELSAVMGLSPFVTREKFKLIKAGIVKQYFNAAMKQGVALEQQVREWAENHFDCKLSDPVFVRGSYLASLDGYNEKQELVAEFKVSSKTYEDLKAGIVSAAYLWQIYQQLYCSDGKVGYLIAYCPKEQDFAVSEPINPHPQFKEIADKAWAEFDAMPMPEGDVDESSNLALKSLFDQYSALKASADAITEQMAIVKDKIIEFAVPERTTVCDGYKIIFKKGATKVDYKSAATAAKIDLAPYTKQGEPSWMLSMKPSPFEATE